MMTALNNPQGRVLTGVLAVLLLLAALLVSPWLWRTLRAEIIYVRPTATGAGNGTSWDNATTLQDALDHRARARDEVWIAAGTHYPVVPADGAAVTDAERDISFVVPSGVALYGGFAGTETERAQRDPATHTTVLSGDIDQNDELDDSNSYTVVNLSGTDTTTLLDGLTITGGYAEGGRYWDSASPPSKTGSGIYIVAGSPTLTNIRIVGNSGGYRHGAAVYVASGAGRWAAASQPTFTDVTISENVGGSVVVMITWESQVAFTGGTISSNAYDGVWISGDSTVTFSDMTITDNGHDGVVAQSASSATFSDTTISSNDFGGVDIHSWSSATFTNVTITDNGFSGVDIRSRSSATFTDVTISDNGGRGMYIGQESSPTCTNVIIRDNGDADVEYVGSQPPTTCLPEEPR